MSEPGISDLLRVEQAIEVLDSAPVAPRASELPLHEAQGLILAEDIRCDRDYPPFDKSQMDGFAVRCEDVAALPAELEVVGEIAAGASASRRLGPRQAMAIMTGAPLPAGADGVVPVEDAETVAGGGATHVRILRAGDPRRYVSPRGSDARSGQTAVRAGMRLEAGALAAAAMVGAATVRAYAAPRVAVLATGDEIVPYDQKPGASQIRNSNSVMMLALLRRMGCPAVDLGVAADSPDIIRERIALGAQMDAMMISGGMSMGRYDHVPRILREMGADLRLTKLRIKPGKPFIYATLAREKVAGPAVHGPQTGTCHIFGLPGNPVSGFVCTVRLVQRVLSRLAGGKPQERWLWARLVAPLPANGPRQFYQPARLEYRTEGLFVGPLGWKGSADLFTLAEADTLLVRGEDEPALPQGSPVRVMTI